MRMHARMPIEGVAEGGMCDERIVRSVAAFKEMRVVIGRGRGQVREQHRSDARRQRRRQADHRNGKTSMNPTLTASKAIAVGICVLICPYLSRISSSAGGTRLKLAAMGVHSVPQKPESMATAKSGAGWAPIRSTSSGQPIAAVMIGKAANALPMMMVKPAIPSA